jgi:hypothetical protein
VTRPLSGPDQPSFLGSGARMRLSPVRAPPVAIARSEVGYPDPRDPDTFCRELVAETAGGAASARCTKRAPSTNPPGEAACAKPAPGDPTFARPSGRAASGDPPRRGARLAEPKVPSVVGCSLEGWGHARRTGHEPLTPGGWAVVHRLFPACGDLAGAFSTPAAGIHFDKAYPGKGLGPLISCSGPKAVTRERGTAAPPTTSAFKMIRGLDVPQNFREPKSLFCHRFANKKLPWARLFCP